MELWGGIECTVNRVGDAYRDQTRLTGHHDRIDDLARIAALGIRTLRYPFLWERIAPDAPGQYDWAWTDARVAEMDRLGITPIVGLLHHGSGPRYTSLVADNFVEQFADFAQAVARRYPHLTLWTPVNEPLTTARFSALYGHWYPHSRSQTLFWRALLNQIEGTSAAMRAVRSIVPKAQLVQTEDMGETHSTAPLRRIAWHYNQRRWAGFDLLEGWIDEAHPLWADIERVGVGDRVLAFARRPCPPDLIGINHYVTSDRFLDHRSNVFGPVPSSWYHDVPAARILDAPSAGVGGAVRATWERYRRPIAVTESHLGCTRDEQLRWLRDGWDAMTQLQTEGVDVRAITSWALFGGYDWPSLLTRDEGRYESGAFDTRGPEVRETALAGLVRTLATKREPASHPALGNVGWWQRPVRFEHLPDTEDQAPDGPPVLVTGATGTLGRAFARACRLRHLPVVLTDRAACDLDSPSSIEAAIARHRPWAIVNAAGWVRVDDAEDEVEACMAANRDGAERLAQVAAGHGCAFASFSSDLVFGGRDDRSYLETDAPAPLNVYGRSKAEAEERILRAHPSALVVRTAAFFSPYDNHNFAVQVENAVREHCGVFVAQGYVVCPTLVRDLVDATLDLLIDGVSGIRHLTNGDARDWCRFGRDIVEALGGDPNLVCPADAAALGWRAPRPRQVPLGSLHGRVLPPLGDAIARFAAARTPIARMRAAA